LTRPMPMFNIFSDFYEPHEVNPALQRFVGDANRHGLHGYLAGQQ